MSTTLSWDLYARDRASQSFDKVGDSADRSGGKVSKWGKAAAGAMAATAAAAAGGAIVIGQAFSDMLGNEKVNDRLAASLGATPETAEKYGEISSRLYAGAWGESMGDVAAAVESVASSFRGLGSKELERASAQAMDFASIFEVDLPRATSVASNVFKSGLAKDAEEAFDLMTAASQRVPKDLREDVMDAAEEYSQFFATLGFNGEEAFSTLVRGAEKGVYGIDKAGDAIKEFTIRSTDMSTASTAAYDAIGLDAEEMADRIVAGGDSAQQATQDIIKGLLSIESPSARANAAIALFGTPLEDLNVKHIPDFLRSLQTSESALGDWSGAITKAGDTLNDNASTKIEAWKRGMQTKVVDFLGGTVIPGLERFSDWFGEEAGPAIDEFSGWLTGRLFPALRELKDDVLEGAREGFDRISRSMEDNKPFIDALRDGLEWVGDVLVDDVLPAVGEFYKVYLPALGSAIGTGISVTKDLASGFLKMSEWGIKAFRFLLDAGMTAMGGILAAADTGLSWIPGLGDKIGNARRAFDTFRERTIENLDKTAEKLGNLHARINGLPASKDFTLHLKVTGQKALQDALTTGGGGVTKPTGADDLTGLLGGERSSGRTVPVAPRGAGGPGTYDLALLKQAFLEALIEALMQLPILRLPNDGQAAYAQTGMGY